MKKQSNKSKKTAKAKPRKITVELEEDEFLELLSFSCSFMTVGDLPSSSKSPTYRIIKKIYEQMSKKATQDEMAEISVMIVAATEALKNPEISLGMDRAINGLADLSEKTQQNINEINDNIKNL